MEVFSVLYRCQSTDGSTPPRFIKVLHTDADAVPNGRQDADGGSRIHRQFMALVEPDPRQEALPHPHW